MKVTKIEKSKKKNYFVIILDNNERIEVLEDVIIDLNLLSNKDIDIKQLISKKDYYDIYNKVLGYINYRMRSQNEIEKYIIKYTNDSNIKNNIINKLVSNNYINDDEYVKRYINDKINLSKDGPLKIKRDLLNLNIDLNIIDKYISNIDLKQIEERLGNLVNKYIKTHNKYSLYELKRKTISYFINLGYDKDLILSIIDNIKVEVDNRNIQKEYDKLYKKYKDKYKDNFEYQIKMRLYQKGYSNEEIEKIRK
ncbi:MAG: RecX family transcriptional regulator [Bacilli bacterium]|nr:RecX family transcriptional regulator [Bacilli bacterium]